MIYELGVLFGWLIDSSESPGPIDQSWIQNLRTYHSEIVREK